MVLLGGINLRSLKMSEDFDQMTLCLQLLSCSTGRSFKGHRAETGAHTRWNEPSSQLLKAFGLL